ncbi:MAG TPA: cystathionine beta-lyase/cystathionine gamma-synthase [Clostridiales bacterium]|nr:cystathionine beta-lyase/cystathionine gamma-synthase [Clostridiales bacterium]
MNDKNCENNICAHLADEDYRVYGSIVPPMFLNSLFTRKSNDTPYSYSRVTNPTVELAEKKITALEGGAWTKCFASGMAAISTAVLSICKTGDEIICVKNVYSGFQGLCAIQLKNFGITVHYVNAGCTDEFKNAITSNVKLIYLESPTSLVFDMTDLSAVCNIAKEHDLLVLMDNTWATPMFQKPIEFGVDLVIHSCTKYMGGHSDLIAGSVTGTDLSLEKAVLNTRTNLGCSISPHTAWLLTRGLRTLPIRMKQHQESGMKFYHGIKNHPNVSHVFFPGADDYQQKDLVQKYLKGTSGLLSLMIRGDYDRVHAALKTLEYFEEGCSWGGFESLYIMLNANDCQWNGKKEGCTMVRVSIGLEEVDTLINDFTSALNHIL